MSTRKCPRGHALPHKTEMGTCTALFCSLEATYKNAAPAQKTEESLPPAELPKPRPTEPKTLVEASDEMLDRLDARIKVHEAKSARFGTPSNLEGADAEEWADKKLVGLLPTAVGELEAQLKTGTPDERRWAAKMVLEATGRGKREAQQQSGPAILLVGMNQVAGQVAVPWAQRIDPAQLAELADVKGGKK